MTQQALPWPADRTERRAVADLIPYAQNARTHSPAQVTQIAASIREFGFAVPLLIDERGEVIAGHGRLLAAQEAGLTEIPVMIAKGWTTKQIKAYRIADNKLALNAAWDVGLLAAELEGMMDMTELIGFDEGELEAMLRADESRPLPTKEEARLTLAQRFGLPPFSVLNAREGWWQDRKRAWLALGIESELGRGENLLKFSDTANDFMTTTGKGRNKGKMANGKRAAATFGQDLMRGEHVIGRKHTASLKGGLTLGTTTDPYREEKRVEKGAIVKGNGWGDGGPARRDAAFYAKKRAWEKANGRKIDTTEFREKYWDGATVEPKPKGLAIQTSAWVNDKIAEGDIAGGMSSGQTGTSIFDPVLCEVAYRWFAPQASIILDPFAGGSVRGIVASHLGHRYHGFDLSGRQIEANRAQGAVLCADNPPIWTQGDSRQIAAMAKGVEADLIFSCPPYADLEVYSDDPLDLSTLAYPDFKVPYADIIRQSCALLKEDRFAVFVVGEVRDRQGRYYGFVPDTVAAFQSAGLHFYNEAILVTQAGSLPIRAGKQFESTRKLGKTHQNVLVFCKGDARKATAACGAVEFGEVSDAADSMAGFEVGNA